MTGVSVLSKAAAHAKLDRAAAIPFGVVSPFFDPDFAERLYQEFPPREAFKARFSAKGILQDLAIEVSASNVSHFGPATQQIYEFSRSRAYADYLLSFAGVRIDPNLTTVWFNTYPDGHSLDAHVDKRRASSGEVRPLTQVIHLTKQWTPEEGGCFLLSQKPDLGAPVLSMNPGFNTAVAFERTKDAWHGVTEIRGAAGAYRKTLVIVVQSRDLLSYAYAVRSLTHTTRKRRPRMS